MSGSLNLSGYKLTFDSEFADMKSSDFGLPGTPGIVWETNAFYDGAQPASGTWGTINTAVPGAAGSNMSITPQGLDMHITSSKVPYLDTNPSGVPGGFSQQYGYFEMTAKLPTGTGFDSAFWLLPNSGPWPPEIDIEESQGTFPNFVSLTNHGGDASTPAQFQYYWNMPDLSAAFHTYGLMWTPTTLTWYIDGQPMFSAPTAGNENLPMNVIVSAYAQQSEDVVAGTSADYIVKDVHVYSNDPNAKEIAGQAGYQDHDGSQSLGGTTTGGTTSGGGTTPPPPAPSPSPVTVGTGSDSLVLSVSEDAYQGDAQFTVSVDGKQVGGTFTAQASHSTGSDQTFTLNGDWSVGTHTVAVNFLNNDPELYDGTPATDRNLYVDAVKYDGANLNQSLSLMSSGAQSFTFSDTTPVPSATSPPPPPTAPAPVNAGTGSDSLVLKISEDAYQGDAQFTVTVDGKQIGGTFTAQAAHASGMDQLFTLNGDWDVGQHTVAVDFLNDAYAGTPATDRNLYVDAISYDGKDTGQSAAMFSQGVQNFTFSDTTPLAPPPAAPAPIPFAVPGAGAFTDATGNVWTIRASDDWVLENGAQTNEGGGTGAIQYANGTVYAQDAASGTWYDWVNNAQWVQATTQPPANTTAGASPTTLTLTPTQTAAVTISESNLDVVATAGAHTVTVNGTGNVVTLAGGTETISALLGHNTITTGSGNDKITFAGSGNKIDAGTGANTLADQGSGNTIVMASIGSKDTISGKMLSNGDKLDFTNALKGTNWDGLATDLDGYLKVSSDGAGGSLVKMSSTMGGSMSTIADLQGVGRISLSTLLIHSLT